MYSMLKKIITEKDIHRQILLLEQLLNHPQLTAKELAKNIGTTERTIFSDLHLIRHYLPEHWTLDSDNSGIRLLSQEKALTNDLWEAFLPHSVSLQLIKELFFTKELNILRFLDETGVSYETLKRHRAKINRQLQSFNIKIRLTSTNAYLIGEESAIRIFYHRLLLPFTHNNYFFEDYSIHEEHYLYFLTKRITDGLSVETEQIFGICWFFINSIRIKAGCSINDFSFEANDPLFSLYAPLLKELYEKEGVYLQEEEIFFAFFCFLESWNYNNPLGKNVSKVLTQEYPLLRKNAQEAVQEIADALHLQALLQTNLATNIVLLLLKYAESPVLSKQFQLEYQELLLQRNDQYAILAEASTKLFKRLPQFSTIGDTTYFVNLFSLLGQQAIYTIQPPSKTVFFIFQSEPSWKAFLQQELGDLLGKRVNLVPLEISQLPETMMGAGDLILSNIPLDSIPVPILYLSTIPTKNELSQLTELTSHSYL